MMKVQKTRISKIASYGRILTHCFFFKELSVVLNFAQASAKIAGA